MKKILPVCLLSLALMLTFASCKNKNNDVIDSTSDKNYPTENNGGDNTPSHTHDFGLWLITAEATENEGGLKERICACGEKEIRVTGKWSTGLQYTMNSDKAGYSVTGIGTCTDTEIVIPDVYEGLPVTRIGDRAFIDCAYLTDITVSSNITAIGIDAFTGCAGLVRTKGGVSYVDRWIIDFDTSMTKAVLESECVGIANFAFSSTALVEIEIPDSVAVIGDYAFYNCERLNNITIPDNITRIGDYAFNSCPRLVICCEVYSQPSSWSSKWNYSKCPTVWDCKNNETADDGCIYTVCDGIRYGLKDNEAVVVTQSPDITDILIPAEVVYNGVSYAVTAIGESAFSDCASLTAITIHNGITSIGASAFKNCVSLTSITLPGGISKIGKSTFEGCTGLSEIIIPNGITAIGTSAFFGCTALTEITIPESVTSIEARAFYNCQSLTEIVIPSNVTAISNYLFSGCSALSSVTLPDNLASIGNAAFSGCISLTEIAIPKSITSIGGSALYGCEKLSSITFGGSTTQWNSIKKGYNWDAECGEYTVYCTD